MIDLRSFDIETPSDLFTLIDVLEQEAKTLEGITVSASVPKKRLYIHITCYGPTILYSADGETLIAEVTFEQFFEKVSLFYGFE